MKKNFRIAKVIPLKWKVWFHFHFGQPVEYGFGGAFNGQEVRKRIFEEILENFVPRAIIETGTYGGVTSSHLADSADCNVYTVEAFPPIFYHTRLKLKKNRRIKTYLGDSRDFLKKLAVDLRVPKSAVFFYLDAHWSDDLPLLEEVKLIGEYWSQSIIMIDDFEVPGDSGYEFDDYGPGKRLCVDYLEPVLSRWEAFFPNTPSTMETGRKRGCVVLVKKDLLPLKRNFELLTRFPFSQ